MNQAITLLSSLCVVIFFVFWLNRSEYRLHQNLIKQEQQTRDSLSQIYAKFVTESDSMKQIINVLQQDLNSKINLFRYDLYKIRIIQVNHSNYSNDTILIGRLLSGYSGR